MAKAPKRTHLPTVAKWLTNTIHKSDDGQYYYRRLEENLAIRADVVKELQVLVHQAHEDARQPLKNLIGIAESLDPLEEQETPGSENLSIDDFPRCLNHTTLKGYFGEIMAAVVAENFNPLDEDWQIVAFPFRSHQMAYHAFEKVRQEGGAAPTIIGRFGDDMLAFQRDRQNKITHVLFGEAKCTARHDRTLITDAHQKSSDSKIIPVDCSLLIAILKDYTLPGSDEESWIESLRALYFSHKSLNHERCDFVSYICGLPPVKTSTVIIPKSAPHENYIANRRLEAVEIHLHDVDGLIEEIYQSITPSLTCTLTKSELSIVWGKVISYIPCQHHQLLKENCCLLFFDEETVVVGIYLLTNFRKVQLITKKIQYAFKESGKFVPSDATATINIKLKIANTTVAYNNTPTVLDS
jgi:hypothetical protein